MAVCIVCITHQSLSLSSTETAGSVEQRGPGQGPCPDNRHHVHQRGPGRAAAKILQQDDQMPYYMISLVLVILSVSLQVVGGLISSCLNRYEAYYQKHEGDICDDVRENFCCCFSPASTIHDTLERRCCTCLSLDYSTETSLRELYQWTRRFTKNRKENLMAEVEVEYLNQETSSPVERTRVRSGWRQERRNIRTTCSPERGEE